MPILVPLTMPKIEVIPCSHNSPVNIHGGGSFWKGCTRQKGSYSWFFITLMKCGGYSIANIKALYTVSSWETVRKLLLLYPSEENTSFTHITQLANEEPGNPTKLACSESKLWTFNGI